MQTKTNNTKAANKVVKAKAVKSDTKVSKAKVTKAKAAPAQTIVQSLTAPLVVSTEIKGKTVERAYKKINGPVAQIVQLHLQGLTQKQIIAAGYNKSTVYRQVLAYKQFAGTAAAAQTAVTK